MNTYIKILLGTCCSFSILSCSNNLDETVYSKVTEQTYNYTVDDFTPSIASVYSYLRSQSDHWGYFCAQEVSADAIVMPMPLVGMMVAHTAVCIIKPGIQSKTM